MVNPVGLSRLSLRQRGLRETRQHEILDHALKCSYLYDFEQMSVGPVETVQARSCLDNWAKRLYS